MAFFKRKEKAPAEVQRLDWKLLERGAVALYHKSNVLSADLAWFRQQNYAIHELNAVTWATPADFHADAQRALSFPPPGAEAGFSDCPFAIVPKTSSETIGPSFLSCWTSSAAFAWI